MLQPTRTDPSYNVVSSSRESLDAIFAPQRVAVIGASERQGSVGRTILWNLISNPFGGTVYPVNPGRPSVLGIKAYPSVRDLPDTIDLAVIVTPAPTVPGVVRECAEMGAKGAIIISAGFKEIGEVGVQLEKEVLEAARAGHMRIIGPNCLGVMRPTNGLNATFAGAMARPGKVAFISQSGALLTAILDWSFRENVGFSSFVSIGSMLDVSWGDLIYYFGDDPRTESIVLYMESIGDARSFLSAAREVALSKPIIVIKAGRTAQAAQAAASHTGTLAGSDEVLDAAFRRSGVLRVDSISDLFYMAEVLGKQPRPRGKKLTILTNAGGPGVLATDALVQGGGELTPLSETAMSRLDEILPGAWSHNNPVDVLGDAGPDRYAEALEIAAEDENADGLLVILTPQDMTDPTQTAEKLKVYAHSTGKPVLASWMGGAAVEAGDRILSQAGIPTFGYPDAAARVFNYMWQYAYSLRGIYETPALAEDAGEEPDREGAHALLESVQAEGRTLLTEHESKALLATYGIPVTQTHRAATADEAVARAEDIGFPVVVKLDSRTITHKVDVGGVKLNLRTAEAVRQAYDEIRTSLDARGQLGGFDGVTVQPMIKLDGLEVILGSSQDAQFGPVVLFGSGGSLVEVYRDRALGLPPLNTTLARRMMEQTKIYEALKGVRGQKGADMDALEGLVVRFSQLVAEQRLIKELDINPLLASADSLLALDARVVLHPAGTDLDTIPRLAIRPYPRQYVRPWTMLDGREVLIRPIRPEDEPLLVAFHHDLSEQSVYLRYAGVMKLALRTAHERLARICFNDYDRELGLVAEVRNPETGAPEIAGVGRLTKLFGTQDGEFAMLVSDRYQRQGLGTEMLRRLVEVGEEEGLARIVADVLPENRAMQRVTQRLGFDITGGMDEGMVKVTKRLGR